MQDSCVDRKVIIKVQYHELQKCASTDYSIKLILLGFKTVIFFMCYAFNLNSKIASRTKQIHWQQMVASFDVLPNVSLISFPTNFTFLYFNEFVCQ